MKSATLLLVLCLIATGLARPPVFLSYQDSLGQYSFGYSAPGSARSEVRTSDGATRGTYSYVDETGVIQTAQYVAGVNGFRVTATNLPQAPLPVQDTPEVMAARVAHLQALEMATRRDEQAHSHGEHRENAQERKIEGNQDDGNLDKTQEQPEAKSAQDLLKAEQQDSEVDNTGNLEPQKENDETLQAIATKSGVDKKSEKNLQGIRIQESSGRATQEIIVGANIPAIPLISSHVLLPQALGQHAVPVFRISHGNHEIEPSAIPESSIAQGASGVITPAATTLQSGGTSIEGATTPIKTGPQTQRANVQAQIANTVIAPLSVIPLSSAHSSFIRYVSPASLHYVTYNVL
ncbi:uncharacterized protein LOC105275608 isoform X1 [Ooceraea biroi]|uniref:uncharacterized protein LOC105275608 isoform X1 n=1 Tax=Ooceraea biroi TaxID=2015173 RepID=UPI000F098458|nr:uncharacterized protein LOC105275608 isoform X1 [Ooceraea biroi]